MAKAVRAQVADILVVSTLVKEAADLVHPAAALVALHPSLFLLAVVLALHNLQLLDALPVHIHEVPLLVLITVVAPVAFQLDHRCCGVVGLHEKAGLRTLME